MKFFEEYAGRFAELWRIYMSYLYVVRGSAPMESAGPTRSARRGQRFPNMPS